MLSISIQYLKIKTTIKGYKSSIMIPFLPILFANSSMVFSSNGLRVFNLTFQYPSSSSCLIRMSGFRFNQYHARGLSSFIALLISFVSYFTICNSLFSICQLYASFSALLFTLRRPCKTELFSVSPLACRLNAG